MKYYVKDNLKISYIETNLTEEEHIQQGFKIIEEITIEDLKKWFDEYYQQHEQKYRRLHTMKKLCDDGSSPLEKLYSLYDEAEEKRKEIQRLEQGGDENGTLYDNTL